MINAKNMKLFLKFAGNVLKRGLKEHRFFLCTDCFSIAAFSCSHKKGGGRLWCNEGVFGGADAVF